MKILDAVKGWKKEQILMLFLAGVLLLVISIPTKESSEKITPVQVPTGTQTEPMNRSERLERRLKEVLSHVAGAGKVDAMLMLKSDGRKIVEKDQEGSEEKEIRNDSESQREERVNNSRNETTVYQKDSGGNETPFVTEFVEPEISGVLVVAQGAGDPVTAKEITEAVMALFGVEAHKIKVMKMQ